MERLGIDDVDIGAGLAVAEAIDGLGEGGGLVVMGEEAEEDGRHRWSVLTYQSRVTP
jgi:hypothetical protein